MSTDLPPEMLGVIDANIALQRRVHTAGEAIHGYVQLKIMPGAALVRAVTARLTGQTDCEVGYVLSQAHGDGCRRAETAFQSLEFLALKAPVVTFPDGKPPIGTLQCPFEFQLPNGAPANMVLEGKLRSTAKIDYFISVTVEIADGSGWKNTMVNRVPVHVATKQPEPSEAKRNEDCVIIKRWGCWSVGSLRVATSSPQTTCHDGDVLHLDYEVDNQTKYPVTSLSVSLRQTQHWATTEHRVVEGGVMQPAKRSGNTSELVKLNMAPVAAGEAIGFSKGSESAHVKLAIPADVHPSVRINTVGVSYSVRVSAVSARSETPAAEVDIPITIFKNPARIQAWPSPDRLAPAKASPHDPREFVPVSDTIPYKPDAALDVQAVPGLEHCAQGKTDAEPAPVSSSAA